MPQNFVQFYTSNARGDRDQQKQPRFDMSEKPTTEKLQTNLVSPSKRSQEQVTDVLRRKLKIKRQTSKKRKQSSVNKQRKRTHKQRQKSKRKSKSAKARNSRKDIFD